MTVRAGPGHSLSTLFLAQHERPSRLAEVALAELGPELRMLVCHDGTLTTALEARLLAPVAVEVRSQRRVRLGTTPARLMLAGPGSPAIERQVAITGAADSRPLVRAASLVMPERLPEGFGKALETARKGIG